MRPEDGGHSVKDVPAVLLIDDPGCGSASDRIAVTL
jgi:hypothetical protein